MAMTPTFKVGPTYARNVKSQARIKVHEGGTSSGKTVGTLQYLLVQSFLPENKGQLFSVVRETTPNLFRGPMNDWREIVLPSAGAMGEFSENVQKKTWTNRQTGVRVEFLALDKEEKGRGPRRNKLFLNEGQEMPFSIARQLMRRTRGETIIDYNPSLLRWWIDTEILTREDAEIFYSTYKDNPFLSDDEVKEIESDVPTYEETGGKIVQDWDLTYVGDGRLIKGDPYEWAVYGLGRRGSPSEAVYPMNEVGEFPDGEFVRGLDFGYEHPTALMDVMRIDADPKPRLHVRQQIFQSGLTNRALLEKMESLGIDKRILIIADSSRPEAIREIADAGFNIIPTKKGPGSVLDGIDYVKGHTIIFTKESEAARIQFENYRRKKVAGIVQDDPVKKEDDAPDAVRYAAFEHYGSGITYGLWGA